MVNTEWSVCSYSMYRLMHFSHAAFSSHSFFSVVWLQALSSWVKHPYIKICPLTTSPKGWGGGGVTLSGIDVFFNHRVVFQLFCTVIVGKVSLLPHFYIFPIAFVAKFIMRKGSVVICLTKYCMVPLVRESGKSGMSRSYGSAMYSLNFSLFRLNPVSFRGGAHNQVDATFCSRFWMTQAGLLWRFCGVLTFEHFPILLKFLIWLLLFYPYWDFLTCPILSFHLSSTFSGRQNFLHSSTSWIEFIIPTLLSFVGLGTQEGQGGIHSVWHLFESVYSSLIFG